MTQIKGFPDYYINGDDVYRRYKNGIAKKLKPFASDPTTPANRVTLYNKGVRKRLSIETIKNMVVLDIPKEESTKKKIKNKYIHRLTNTLPTHLNIDSNFKFKFSRKWKISDLNDYFGTNYHNNAITDRYFKVVNNVISCITNKHSYATYPVKEINFLDLVNVFKKNKTAKSKKCLEVIRDKDNKIVDYVKVNYEFITIIDGIAIQDAFTDKHKIVEVIYE